MMRCVPASLLLAGWMAFQLTTASAQPVTLETFLRGAGYYSVRLQEGEFGLLAKAKVNGKRAALAVDSGCPITTLSPPLGGKLPTLGTLNVRLKDSHLGELSHPNLHVISRLGLGEAIFLNQPAVVMPGRRADAGGSLGSDFLLRQHCVLDTAGLRLFVRGTNPPPEVESALQLSLRQSGFMEVPVTFSNPLVCHVDAEVNGTPVRLGLKTGSPFTAFEQRLADRLGLDGEPVKLAVRGVGDVRLDALKSARVDSLRLGGVEFGPVDILTIGLDTLGVRVEAKPEDDVQGLLGLPWMLQQRVILDYHGKRLWLYPDASRRPGG